MNRARKVFIRMNLALLLCVVFATTRGWAQSPDDTQANQSPTPQTQMGQQQQGQEANQNSDEAPTQVEQTPQMEPAPALPADATQENQTMSAAQILGILQAEPDLLDTVKDQIAQESGVDPTTLTEQSVFERIRESEQTRVLATKELVARGYSVNPEERGSPASTAAGSKTTSSTGRGTQPPRKEAAPYENPDNPQVHLQKIPYSNMPSLTDIYSQFSATGAKLKRFGSDAFLIGTGNANLLPMDLPAGPDYVLGPGDNLTLNLWGGMDQRLNRSIDRQGQLELPEAGPVMISGLTIEQAQTAIQKTLDSQFHGEHVEISLGRLRTVRVYVVGDVQRPGAYDVSSLSTALSALFAAGGPTSRGSLRIMRQMRGDKLVRQIDLYDFLLHGIRSSDDRLQAGDTILVPPAGPQVTVEGMVHRPAIYELNGEQSLNQILDLAGGVLVSASLKQIHVERIEAHESRTMVDLQLPDNPAEAAEKLAAFNVKDGDDVVITQIQPYNSQAVYLEGHVFHPGKYPYKEGMTIADLLRSYQDVMPEPAERGELVRLLPPDFRPEYRSSPDGASPSPHDKRAKSV